jgi:hypothetical protein
MAKHFFLRNYVGKGNSSYKRDRGRIDNNPEFMGDYKG